MREARPDARLEAIWSSPARSREKTSTVTDIHESLRGQGLVRPRDGRVLAGVCAGLGRRFGLDPWPARLLFVLALMVLPGSQLIVYPILWILMPLETRAESWRQG